MRRTRSRADRTGFESEAELAKVVVDWLRAQGWTVFQEVEHRGAIADIVATRGEDVAVVECKLGVNLAVLDQAHHWLGYARFVFAAVPSYGNGSLRPFFSVVCEAIGLGLLTISPPFFEHQGRVIVTRDAKPTRVSTTMLRDRLRPEMVDYAAAGSPTGKRWTRFRETEKLLLAYVTAHPGELAKTAVAAIAHHWRGKKPHASALAWIHRGVIGGIRAEESREGARLFPIVEGAAPQPPPAETTAAPAAASPRPPAPLTTHRIRRRRRRWHS